MRIVILDRSEFFDRPIQAGMADFYLATSQVFLRRLQDLAQETTLVIAIESRLGNITRILPPFAHAFGLSEGLFELFLRRFSRALIQS